MILPLLLGVCVWGGGGGDVGMCQCRVRVLKSSSNISDLVNSYLSYTFTKGAFIHKIGPMKEINFRYTAKLLMYSHCALTGQ